MVVVEFLAGGAPGRYSAAQNACSTDWGLWERRREEPRRPEGPRDLYVRSGVGSVALPIREHRAQTGAFEPAIRRRQ